MSIPHYAVTAVEVVGPTTIRVTHADGTVAEHNLARLIENGGVFAALADPEFFRQVRIAHGVVTWPGEIDLAPDALRDHVYGRCTGCGWTPDETTVIALPDETPRTVGELIAALQELAPDMPVVAPAPHGGYGNARIDTATLQERAGHPPGEGRYALAELPLSAGDRPIGTPFTALVLRCGTEESAAGQALAAAQERIARGEAQSSPQEREEKR